MHSTTLAIVKPSISINSQILSKIEQHMRNSGLDIIQYKHFNPTHAQLDAFYNEHANKFYFQRLLLSMSSGSIHCYVLSGQDAIQKWRNLIGPNKVYLSKYTQPHTLRSLYGLTDTRNTFHGSSNQEEAINEINIIFNSSYS